MSLINASLSRWPALTSLPKTKRAPSSTTTLRWLSSWGSRSKRTKNNAPLVNSQNCGGKRRASPTHIVDRNAIFSPYLASNLIRQRGFLPPLCGLSRTPHSSQENLSKRPVNTNASKGSLFCVPKLREPLYVIGGSNAGEALDP